MHDKHGRELNVGDVVVGTNYGTGMKPAALLVRRCMEGATSCNLACDSFHPKDPTMTLNAHETVLVIKADGTIVKQPDEV